MESTPTIQELVNEGQKALERGDKAVALSNFIVATQLHPEDKSLWLQRARATSDPHEAMQCYEQVLKIDPDDPDARDMLLLSQLDSLQTEAQVTTDPASNSGRPSLWARLFGESQGVQWRVWVVLSVLTFFSVCGLGFVAVGLVANNSSQSSVEASDPTATAALLVLQLPPTWTPAPTKTPRPTWVPTPSPVWKVVRNVTIRSGPGVTYASLGILLEGNAVSVISRAPDGKFVQTEYADGKRGWVSADFLNMASAEIAALPTAAVIPPAPVLAKPTLRPTVRPSDTPVPQLDYMLGRPAELIADCSRAWKVIGTIYDSPAGGRRLNGVLIRVWAFNQLQGTTVSGSSNVNMPGYWEWSFNRNGEVAGQVAVVHADGSLRSQPVSFRLTSNCDGAGAVNQIVIDFVGK